MKATLFLRRTTLLAMLSLGLVACNPKPGFKSTDITGINYAQNFEASDTEGQVRRLADFKGKAVVVFFGYTQCPDFCPTTMQELTQARQLMGEKAKQVQVVFITFDPERDTPEVLRAYMQAFDPSYVALIPTAQQLEQLAKDFKIFYKKVPGKTPTSYSFDHTAGSYVFDPSGHIRLFPHYGMDPKALAADLQQLL